MMVVVVVVITLHYLFDLTFTGQKVNMWVISTPSLMVCVISAFPCFPPLVPRLNPQEETHQRRKTKVQLKVVEVREQTGPRADLTQSFFNFSWSDGAAGVSVFLRLRSRKALMLEDW